MTTRPSRPRPFSRCLPDPFRRTALAAVTVLLIARGALAQGTRADVSGMSIEELMKVDVTTVSRRAERLQETAAAVTVLTSEDIRRSGATSIPDVLRLVPGVHVARIDSNKWSVSVRGFTGRYSNKLLVLIDGRSVYTPLFSGVIWDAVSVPLATIERIEVIRGPGATMWGANAVNGVINIITRSASASAGVQATAATGTEDRALFSLTAGRQVTAASAVRGDVALATTDASQPAPLSPDSSDRWLNLRVGMRADSRISARDEFSVQAAYTASRIDDAWLFPTLVVPYGAVTTGVARHAVAFTSAEWRGTAAPGETTVRGSVEHSNVQEGFAGEHRFTLALEAQRTQRMGRRHTLVAGLSERYSRDDLTQSTWAQFSPPQRTLQWRSIFGQDDVTFAGGRVRATAGLKMEHNDYTGWEVQPNVRGLWSITNTQAMWAAVSRAVRLPSRGEADSTLWLLTGVTPTSPVPVRVRLEALGRLDAETMHAYEAGYRHQFGSAASIDLSAFDQTYGSLRSVSAPEVGAFELTPAPHVDATVPLSFTASGRRRGIEAAAEWRPHARVRLVGTASWLDGYNNGSPATIVGVPVTDDPPRRLGVGRVSLNLPAHVELDGAVRYVSQLATTGVPGYVTADVRLGFRIGSVNLSFAGRNLTSASRREFVPEFFGLSRAAAERSLTIRASVSR